MSMIELPKATLVSHSLLQLNEAESDVLSLVTSMA